jgi:uncharacterized protein (TIGR00730 family)
LTEPIEPGNRDRVFLEGPHSRTRELGLLLRALWEFIAGFRVLHFVGPCVTVFGSARLGEDHPSYALGRELGRGLADMGFTVMTGGGPGIMEAANRGAREAGGRSVGCAIQLAHEQATNPYLDRVVTCRYFFVRKVLLFKYSYAFVALPGGLGTLDELFELLALRQTGKAPPLPIVLYDEAFWRDILSFDAMVKHGVISAEDLALFSYAETPEQAWRKLVEGGVLTKWLQEQHTT